MGDHLRPHGRAHGTRNRVDRAIGTHPLAGPVIGGLLYTIDPSVPYFAMAALLVVAAIGVQFVRPRYRPAREERASSPREVLAEALGGFRFVTRHPVLLGAISLDLFAVLFGGAVALLPALAKDELGVGEVGLGWLRAAVGIGAAAVTVDHVGDPPELFQPGIPVVLEGAFASADSAERFSSDLILVKHTEEYSEANPQRMAEAEAQGTSAVCAMGASGG